MKFLELISLPPLALMAALAAPFALAPPAFSCGTAELEKFIADAQALSPETDQKGQSLTSCIQGRDAAVQWWALSLLIRGDALRAALIDHAPSTARPPAGRAERDRIIANAKTGSETQLERKIIAREPGYPLAKDAQLALARVLARHQKFERARTAYLDYLRLDPGDGLAEAEYLFTFIAEGRFDDAEAKLLAARGATDEALSAAATRGLALVQKLRVDRHQEKTVKSLPANALPPGAWPDQMALSLLPSTHKYREDYARQTIEGSYRSTDRMVSLLAATHDIDAKALGKVRARASQGELATHVNFPSVVAADVRAGYFSAGVGAVTYAAALAAEGDRGQAGIFAHASTSRTPLLLEMPLAAADLGLTRDTFSAGFGYARFAAIDLTVAKEPKSSPFEHHRALFRLPVSGPTDANRLELRLPVEYERHPRVSPDYNADPVATSAGAGIEYSGLLGGAWLLHVAVDYELTMYETRAPSPDKRRESGIVADFGAMAGLTEMLSLVIKAHVAKTDDEADRSARSQLNSLALGIVWAPAASFPAPPAR